MDAQRLVKLVRDGEHQSIRIPVEFELPGDDAVIRQEGRTSVIEPIENGNLFDWLSTIEPWDEEFPSINDGHLPLEDVDL